MILDTTVIHRKLVKNVEGVLYVKPGDILMALPQLNPPPRVKVWDCVWDFPPIINRMIMRGN